MAALLLRVPQLIRFLCLQLVLAAPPLLAGAALAGRRGALAGGALSCLGTLWLLLRTEKILIRRLRAEMSLEPGLTATFQLLMDRFHGPAPLLGVYPDPRPQVLVSRCLGGTGTVLVSRGLLLQLNEEELLSVLSMAIGRVRSSRMILMSFGAILCDTLFLGASRGWMRVFFEGFSSREFRPAGKFGPLSLLLFTVLLPWRRMVLLLTLSPAVLNGGKTPLNSVENQRVRDNAMRKMESASPVAGGLEGIGAGFLYLVNPWSRSLFASDPCLPVRLPV